MFLARLFIGLTKGSVLGGLLGYGLVHLGLGMPAALFAYLAAAVCGVLVALLAGKPIWAKEARIEVGMKAVVGALLAPALLFAVRRFLTMGFPFDLAALPGFESLQASQLTVGNFAVTSLAIVGAVLAGFYDADNQPVEESESTAKARGSGQRIATGGGRVSEQQAAEAEAEQAEAQKQQHRS